MNNKQIKNEFAALLAETKEHVRFMQEMGVEQIDAELPEVFLHSNKNEVLRSVASQKSPTEKYIPGDEISKITRSVSQEKQNNSIKPTRRNIFDSARLSDRNSRSEPIKHQPKEVTNSPKPIETMPKKSESKVSLVEELPTSLPESNETLEMIRDEIGKDCQRCQLCEKRTQVVHSVGNPNADLMFIGEAPGADEDEQGEPFVGRAGKLLTKMIEGIDLTREEVFIGNINRCRPPGNRQPQTDEAIICRPFLLREIAVVRPKVIVVMGNTACQNLLDTKIGITKLRGSFKDYFGVKVMPTFHPAYLLRDPRKKREVWEDLKTIRDYLNSTK